MTNTPPPGPGNPGRQPQGPGPQGQSGIPRFSGHPHHSGPQQRPGAHQAHHGMAPHPSHAAQNPAADQQLQASHPQSASYGGFGAFDKKRRSTKKILVGSSIGVLLLAAATVAILWATGVIGGATIDHVAIEKGIAQVMKTNFGEPDAKDASCPDNVDAKPGTTFTCRLKLDGQPKSVSVRIINDSNDYEIGAPK